MLNRQQLIDLDIIQQGIPDNYDETNYNLRIGDEYILIIADTPRFGKFSDNDQNSNLGITIPPFGSVLVSTHEWLRVPAGVYGRWGLKIRPALKGLIFQAGPQIEPKYAGRLFGILFNLSSNPQRIAKEEKLWSIDFTPVNPCLAHSLECLSGDRTLKDGRITDYINPRDLPYGGPNDVLNKIYQEITDLSGLSNKLKNEEQLFQRQINEMRLQISNDLIERQKSENEKIASDLIEQNSSLNSTNQQLLQSLSRQADTKTHLYIGFILIVICAFVPLLISKFTYDKDDFYNLTEGKKNIQEFEQSINVRLTQMESKLGAMADFKLNNNKNQNPANASLENRKNSDAPSKQGTSNTSGQTK